MNSNFRLLIILDPAEAFNPDGSEAKLREITVMMGKEWKIDLISSRPIQYRNLSCDVKVHPIGKWVSPDSFLSRVLYLLLTVFRGVSVVKKHDVQVVMSKDGHLHLGMVALAIKTLTNRKCIVRVNEDDVLALLLFLRRLKTPLLSSPVLLRLIENAARRFERNVFRRADHIITHGPTDFERIKAVTGHIDFVPLWVDMQKFKPAEKRQRSSARRELLGLGNNSKKVALFVGRLHPEKDLETLLLGFKELVDLRDDIILIVVGDGPDEEKCRHLASSLGLSNRVQFVGYVPRNNMPQFYKVADVYVMSSIWEELSNTILEAMACGIPAVVTAVGGNPYLVKEGETGFLVPPKNPQVLAEKVSYVLDHPKEMARVTANALLAVQQFQKKPIGERYKNIITKLISESCPD